MKPMLNTLKTINPATTIVFIDAGVENAELLIEGVIPTTEVLVLDGTADGIEQISQVLQQRQNIDGVHIISHGSPGCLYLGNSQLSLDTLIHNAPQLQKWDVANLLLYGCNVAAGDAGEEFIAKLHALTGAEIAASKTLTGSVAKGGNWELEVTTAKAFATLAFERATLENYPAILGILTGAGATWTYNNDGDGIGDASLGSQFDAYDGFFKFFVNGQPLIPGSGTQSGQTFTTASQRLSGLNVTAQYNANQVTPTLEGVYSLANQTGNAITVPVRWGGNLGSDFSTFIKRTSSGDTILNASDDWVITDDSVAPEAGDPTISHYFIPNAPGVTRTNASLSRDDLYVDYTVTIPAFSTISLRATNVLSGGNVNQAPTDINLSNTSIPENVAANSSVGTFTSTDPNTGNTFTYSLVPGTGDTNNSAFSIVSNQLRINASPDFETKSSYNIRVRTTDQGGLTYEKPLVVNINDIDEFIYGTPNNDILNGTASADQINGLAGSDIIYGKAGNDIINGGDGDDVVYGGNDRDLLRGGNGSDRLYGDAGNDELLGEEGDDILYGGDGDDLLNGGAGSDRLYGNAGIDTFVLASGMGLDSIYNFQDGADRIRLDGGLTFGALQIAPSGNSTLIKVASTGETLASLVNTNSALIGAADFSAAADFSSVIELT